MSRFFWIVVGTLLLVLCVIVAGMTYSRFKKIEDRGPAPEDVSAIVPRDSNSAIATIVGLFNDWADFDQPRATGRYQDKFPAGSRWGHFFLFHKGDPQHPLFPSDQEILLDRGVDSFIGRYVRIPLERRTLDLYLYEPTGDYYWDSEYFYRGQPAKFRCSFFIHVEPRGQWSTIIEVFEYQPTVWVGEYWGMSAHAILPAKLHDIRPVQPTTADREEVLRMISQESDTGTPRSP